MTQPKQTLLRRAAALLAAATLSAAALVVPASAASSDNTFVFSSTGVTASGSGSGYEIDGSDLKITASGTYTITGSSTAGTVTVQKELSDVTLILSGLTLANAETSPITINKASEVTIQVTGSNTLTDNEDMDEASTNTSFEGAGIKVKTGSALQLTGSGSLTVQGNCKNGIKGAAEADITVDGPTLTVTAEDSALSSDGSVTVKSGILKLTAANDGIQSSPDADDTASAGTVTITGGTVGIISTGDGIQATGDLNITGGTFNIKTGGGYQTTLAEEDSAKGIKSDASVNLTGGTYTLDCADDAIHANGDTTVAGGTYSLYTGNDALHADYTLNVGVKGSSTGPSLTTSSSVEGFEGAVVNLYSGSGSITSSDDGVNAANGDLEQGYDFALNVYGGTWKVNASGDGLDSNGDIALYGGLVEVFGSANNGNSAFDYDGTALYEGGTLLAVGMSGMQQTPSTGIYVAFGAQGMMGGGMGGQGGTPPQMNGENADTNQTPPTGQDTTGTQRPGGQRPSGTGFPGRNGATTDGTQENQNTATTSSFTISSGSTIVIKDSSGNTLYSATGLKTANSVVFANEAVVSGESYTLYIDGTAAATATASTGTGKSAGIAGGNQGGDAAGSGFPFLDVADSSWYYSAVRSVYQKGLMKGTSDTAFQPDSTMTRAMLAQILYSLAGSPTVDTSAGFTDVSDDAWYADAVNWAASNRIVSGYTGNRFGPDDKITREQAAAILYRYANYKGYDLSKTTDLSTYDDSASISDYAQSAMNWANASGVLTGTDQNRLLPTGNATRAQAASILTRFTTLYK